MAAVVLGSSLVLALTFALLFRLARRRSDALVALAMTLVAAAGSAGHWLARPHLFTMLFTVVFYSILEQESRAGVPGGCGCCRRSWWSGPICMAVSLSASFDCRLRGRRNSRVLLRETGEEPRPGAPARAWLFDRGRRLHPGHLRESVLLPVARPHLHISGGRVLSRQHHGIPVSELSERASALFRDPAGGRRGRSLRAAAPGAADLAAAVCRDGRIWRSIRHAMWRYSCCWRPRPQPKCYLKVCEKRRRCAWRRGCGAGCAVWRSLLRNGMLSTAGPRWHVCER